MIEGDDVHLIREGDGPWSDRLIDDLVKSALGTFIVARLANPNAPMEETDWDRVCHLSLKYEPPQWNFENRRCNELIESFRLRGFDTREEDAPIAYNLDNDGRYNLTIIPDGYHRSTIAAVMGLPFTLRIEKRAAEWADIRANLYERWSKKYLYQPIPHPDFAAWEIGHGNPDRFKHVGEYLKARGLGRFVGDAGCHFGYQLFWLKTNGYISDGIAFDLDTTALKIADALLGFVGIKSLHCDAERFFSEYDGPRFSAIIATAFIYHLLETHTLEKALHIVRLMGGLADSIIFDDSPGHDVPEFMRTAIGNGITVIGRDTEFNRTIYAMGGLK